MGKKRFIKQTKEQLYSLFIPDKKRIERLREILETEQKREVSFEEAQDIGTHLVSFYENLAGDLRITKGGLKNKKHQ